VRITGRIDDGLPRSPLANAVCRLVTPSSAELATMTADATGVYSVSVAPGTTVTWTNDGDIAHTVTSQDGLFESGLLQSGQDFQFTFDKPGTYSYFCTPHPWMLGQVIVK